MTSLAQLGACRLNTARALVSVFDRDYQYVIAEATPTLSLRPALKHEDRDEDLWLCGTAILRQHGVCEYALRATDPTQFEDGDNPRTLPIAVVADLSADERFSSKPYCQPGSPARFYAAVPIRTPQGINIGVYCVIDTEPRDVALWGPKESELMRSLSGAIVAHLDLRRSTTINRRGNRMNRGISSFINGKRSIDAWSGDPVSVGVDGDVQFGGSPTVALGGLDQPEAQMQEGGIETVLAGSHGTGQREPSIPTTVEEQPPPRFEEPEAVSSSQHDEVGRHDDRNPRQETLRSIFSRAAQIITESVEVDGFLFLDASVGLYGSATGDTDTTQSPSSSAASGEDPEQPEVSSEGQGPFCRVLGVSASEPAPGKGPVPPQFALPHRVLSKLLHRYPKGRIFNFDDKGDLQYSDSSEGQSTLAPRKGSQGSSGDAGGGEAKEKKKLSRLQEGGAIRGALPGVRSVAFVPVWHTTKERWFAGGFAFTYDDHRIFTMEDELSYLRAFSMLTMEECFRLETQMADKAKSDVLNSLSHELRSPLHGIVLGIELLDDTKLSVFQGNIVHTIETCSRTLLDTVDHLLDFSKINNYMAKRKRTAGGERGLRQGRRTIEAGMQTLYSVVRLDVLAADVMESVCAGFNFQHASLSQVGRRSSAAQSDIHANRRLDMMRAMEELGPNQTATGGFRFDFASVSIFLDVESDASWVFNTQPGAVRRIIMNLFGNSLKYTTRGTIVVALRMGSAAKRKGGRTRVVTITVADTGKGIGEDYLRHELFRPFSQEDHLAPGTGLGLSLVKQITSQLKGTVSVSSTVGVGTTITVSLPMLPSEGGSIAPSEENTEFAQAVSAIQGLKVRLVGFSQGRFDEPIDADTAKDERFNNYKLVERICRDWLGLHILPDSDGQTPGLIVCTEAAIDRFTTDSEQPTSIPCVVICSNALIAHQLSITTEFTTNPRAFDFVSQP